MSQESYAPMSQESYATPPSLPPPIGRRRRSVAFLSLWRKDATFFWRLSKDSLSKDRVPSDLYNRGFPIAKVRDSRMSWRPLDSQGK